MWLALNWSVLPQELSPGLSHPHAIRAWVRKNTPAPAPAPEVDLSQEPQARLRIPIATAKKVNKLAAMSSARACSIGGHTPFSPFF